MISVSDLIRSKLLLEIIIYSDIIRENPIKLLTNVLCPQIFQYFVIFLIPFPKDSIQFKKQAEMFKGHSVLRITNKL